mmetsp:Transcript_11250/g.32104  ORF Transcript_11250/g.32104 Transcript_11250/m.32104 type:complete len:401 (+) Transcript_11250:127-1329(+)
MLRRRCLPSACAVLLCGLPGARANIALELPSDEWPIGGASGDDTYSGEASLTTCVALDPYPAAVPWDPTAEEAIALCSGLPGCGGFVYTTAAASAAEGGSGLAYAEYCSPQSFVTGTASSTTGIGFVRRLYDSCDVRLTLPMSVSNWYGALAVRRPACLRPNRGLTPARQGSPRRGAVRHRAQPSPRVQLGGVSYEVGKDVFRSEELAGNLSADGASHMMATVGGVQYHMPGQSHAVSAQPFALDGYFPLYETVEAAQWASTRGGGNGLAFEIGPTTASAQPAKWTRLPGTQVYYMPLDGAKLFLGSYVEPFALDGYFPLYKDRGAAENASADGSASSHGPGSETGHPTWWTTGKSEVLYMPSSGHTKYYGTYVPVVQEPETLYSTRLVSTAVRPLTTEL